MRLPLLLTLIALLAACARPVTQNTPPALEAPSPTAPPTTGPTAPLLASPTAAAPPPPTAVPTQVVLATAAPAAQASAPPPAAPIATLGFGHALRAAFLGPDALALGTSAGVLILRLPALETTGFIPLPGAPEALAATEGGQHIAVGLGGAVQVISSAGGATFSAQGGDPRFSRGGDLLATSGDDPATGRLTTWLYAVPGGALTATLDGGAPRFSPDGTQIVTFAGGEAIFSGRDGVELQRLAATDISFAAQAPLAAVATASGVQVFGFDRAGLGPAIFSSPDLAVAVTLADDGSRLYAWAPPLARIWSLPDGADAGTLIGLHAGMAGLGPEGRLAWSVEGGGESPSRLLVTRDDGWILHSDGAVGGGRPYFSPDGRRVAVVDTAGDLLVYDAEGGLLGRRTVAGYEAAAFDAGDTIFVARREGRGVERWDGGDAPAGELATLSAPMTRARELTVDGERVVIEREAASYLGGLWSMEASAWDGKDGSDELLLGVELPFDQLGYEDRVPWDYSPATGSLARGLPASAGGGLLVSSPGEGEPRPLPPTAGVPQAPPTSLAFSPDGARLAAGYGDGSLVVLRAAELTRAASGPSESSEAVTALAWSGDGRVLAFALAGGGVAVWRPGEEGSAARLSAPAGDAAAPRLALSADGAILAVATSGGVVVYDLTRGEILRLGVKAESVALSSDGARLAAAVDGRIAVWPIP